jgi:hypothetical protein
LIWQKLGLWSGKSWVLGWEKGREEEFPLLLGGG